MAILSVLPVMTKIRDMYYVHSAAGMYDSASLGLALGGAEKYFILVSSAIFCFVFIGTSNIDYRFNGFLGFWVSQKCEVLRLFVRNSNCCFVLLT